MKNTVFFCVFCAVPRGILDWYSDFRAALVNDPNRHAVAAPVVARPPVAATAGASLAALVAVAMSGAPPALSDARQHAIASKMPFHISKPITPSDLAELSLGLGVRGGVTDTEQQPKNPARMDREPARLTEGTPLERLAATQRLMKQESPGSEEHAALLYLRAEQERELQAQLKRRVVPRTSLVVREGLQRLAVASMSGHPTSVFDLADTETAVKSVRGGVTDTERQPKNPARMAALKAVMEREPAGLTEGTPLERLAAIRTLMKQESPGSQAHAALLYLRAEQERELQAQLKREGLSHGSLVVREGLQRLAVASVSGHPTSVSVWQTRRQQLSPSLTMRVMTAFLPLRQALSQEWSRSRIRRWQRQCQTTTPQLRTLTTTTMAWNTLPTMHPSCPPLRITDFHLGKS